MAITKAPKKPTVEEFIDAAPDAGKDESKAKHVKKGKKLQITLTITPPLLQQVDALAERLSVSRAAVINLAIRQSMEHGISVDGTAREKQLI